MPDSFDAVVVGGGLLGTATAYHLVGAGARTLLVDRVDTGRATDAGAGILSPETNSRDPEVWFKLAVAAVEYYPALIERLRGEQGGDTGYARCGQLVVAVSDDEIAPFERARRLVFERQRRRGRPAPTISARSPPPRRASCSPRSRRCTARSTRAAAPAWTAGSSIARCARPPRRAASWSAAGRRGPADPRRRRGDGRRHRRRDGIAAGAWPSPAARGRRRSARSSGVSIPVAPQRGQIIHLGLHGTDTGRWPVISAFHHHYLVAWPDSRVVAGATRETGSGFAPHTTAAGVREVLSEALRVAPGLASAEIREIRVGLRPFASDTLPVLGPVPGVRGVFLVTGHGPSGLTLGPYSAKNVAAQMLGKAPEMDLTPYSIARFASA